MSNNQHRTVYTGEGVRAVLAFEGDVCLFELTADIPFAADTDAVANAVRKPEASARDSSTPSLTRRVTIGSDCEPCSPAYATSREAMLEILLQPRDAAGLPDGAVQLLFSTSVKLRLVPGAKKLRGHCWLPPSLTPGLLEACHFRVQPGKMCIHEQL